MKRIGHVYEQMAVWETIVEAEAVSTRRKLRNCGVRKHAEHRWENLVEIQQSILNRTMKTGEYQHDRRKSGQDKWRDIAKLKFHPNHIQHQLLTITAERRVDKALIRHTYASRKGYGQTAAALQVKKYLQQHRGEDLWYGQGDMTKYYDNMPHALLRSRLERMFKDKAFVDAFMEPFERFSEDGKGIPLGIRPSQLSGNIGLMLLDRYATEVLKCKGYVRYLDDFVFFGKTKGEVNRKMKRLQAFAKALGFEMHVPKVHRVSEGLDILGFVFYGTKNDMFWRKANKRRWLRRRAKVTNPKRIRELDDAAWGMLKWGNSHCKRLFHLKTGDKRTFKGKGKMGISLNRCGFKPTARLDKNGNPFIDAPKVSMEMIAGKPVEVMQVVKGIKTCNGDGRYALRLFFMGGEYKFIANASGIKQFCDDMEAHRVTRWKTVFYDRGGKRYDVDADKTEILEVDGRAIKEKNNRIVFADNDELVPTLNQ